MSTIVIYSRASCAPCKTLKYLLQKHEYPYEEKNIDVPENANELFKLGYASVPVTLVDGYPVVGPDFQSILRLVK